MIDNELEHLYNTLDLDKRPYHGQLIPPEQSPLNKRSKKPKQIDRGVFPEFLHAGIFDKREGAMQTKLKPSSVQDYSSGGCSRGRFFAAPITE